MVVTARRLRQDSSSSGELASIRDKRDELRVSLLELEGEKRAFYGVMIFWPGRRPFWRNRLQSWMDPWSICLSVWRR